MHGKGKGKGKGKGRKHEDIEEPGSMSDAGKGESPQEASSAGSNVTVLPEEEATTGVASSSSGGDGWLDEGVGIEEAGAMSDEGMCKSKDSSSSPTLQMLGAPSDLEHGDEEAVAVRLSPVRKRRR